MQSQSAGCCDRYLQHIQTFVGAFIAYSQYVRWYIPLCHSNKQRALPSVEGGAIAFDYCSTKPPRKSNPKKNSSAELEKPCPAW